jgi:hypothetical protein
MNDSSIAADSLPVTQNDYSLCVNQESACASAHRVSKGKRTQPQIVKPPCQRKSRPINAYMINIHMNKDISFLFPCRQSQDDTNADKNHCVLLVEDQLELT